MITLRRVKKRRGAKVSAALTMAALSLALPQSRALAADWFDDTLRGSFTPGPAVRWDGISFGASIGVTNLNTDFGNSTSAQIAYILRNTSVQEQYAPSNWTTLPSNTTNGRQYGAFLGYTYQWDEIALGFDLAYNRTSSLNASAADTIARQVVTSPDNVNNGLTITARSSSTLLDYATARVRVGYAFGQFLPYAFVGGAVGRFNYVNTATVRNQGTPPVGSPILPFDITETQTSAKNNAIVGGVTTGLGIDVALLPNVFLRGEWEYVGFAMLNGVRSSINTGRVGIGMKF